MASKNVVLNLSTTDFERPVAVIDGDEYEMRAPEEMSRALRRELQASIDRIDSSASGDIDTQEGANEVFDAIESAVKVCMPDLPEDVLGRLPISHQERIITGFLAMLRGGDPSNPESTSSSSLPDSNGSSEAVSATG